MHLHTCTLFTWSVLKYLLNKITYTKPNKARKNYFFELSFCKFKKMPNILSYNNKIYNILGCSYLYLRIFFIFLIYKYCIFHFIHKYLIFSQLKNVLKCYSQFIDTKWKSQQKFYSWNLCIGFPFLYIKYSIYHIKWNILKN